jgi:hypothetical protein
VTQGAVLELASDAWLEALDAATAVRIAAPTLQCVTTQQQTFYDGFACSSAAVAGCGASAGERTMDVTEINPLVTPPPPVSVVHQGSVGPYETVTLHANVPGALPTWLTSHGYAIDADIQPIIDAYTQDGFDFIALRLLPDQGVQQMKPVRVTQPGANVSLPLRMVAAGAGPSVALTLFVIGEGRYQTTNFSGTDRPSSVSWDFSSESSDYATQRQMAVSQGPTWLTAFAVQGAFFVPQTDPSTSAPVQYVTSQGTRTTIADAFMDQAAANGEAELSCAGIYSTLTSSTGQVVDLCPPGGGPCKDPGPDEIDSRYFACGPVDDLAVALLGLHPKDVWVTRLEAELPRPALSTDLQLGASPGQAQLLPVLVATSYTNPPCQVATAGAMSPGPGRPSRRPPLMAAAVVLAAFALARRFLRGAPPLPARSPSPAR